ncbi:MAG: hypothetical protein WBF18_11700 [Solirubrobacterales bacterium]
MLFDIRGKRKRFIQVIYVFLALLLGGGLVLFGIGGDANGGLGDLLGISSNSGSDGSTEFNDEVEAAESRLATDPENPAALLSLARYSYLNGQQSLEVDEEQGTQVVTDEARTDFEASIDAWERYLKANKGQPDASVATLIFRAYTSVAFDSTSPVTIQRRLDGAQDAAAVIAAERPGPTSFLDLASLAYLAGDTKTADKAAKQALAALPDDTGRPALKSQLESAEQQGKQIQKQLKQQAENPDQNALEDPLGTLGGAPADATGTSPPGG